MSTVIEETPWLRQMQSSELDVYGNHPEPHGSLNVRNPQPGMVYYWARKAPGQVQRLMNQGKRPVHNTGPIPTMYDPDQQVKLASLGRLLCGGNGLYCPIHSHLDYRLICGRPTPFHEDNKISGHASQQSWKG